MRTKTRETSWWVAGAAACTLILVLMGCDGVDGESSSSCPGERSSIEGSEYCVGEGPITETGFDCPSEFPHRHEESDLAICSKDRDMPDHHRDELIEQHGSEDGGDSSEEEDDNGLPDDENPGSELDPVDTSSLCDDPSAYAGGTIKIAADDVERFTGATLMECSREPACCNEVNADFAVECPERDASGAAEPAVLLTAAPDTDFPTGEPRSQAAPHGSEPPQGAGRKFGCVGQQCYPTCSPGRLGEMESFTGTHRDHRPFISPSLPSQYEMQLEVEEFSRAGDGCPDFATECPTGCNAIEGRKYIEDEDCVVEHDVIGCTTESADNEVGCVKRDDTEHAHPYRIPESSTADGTDWVTCSQAERDQVTQQHSTCN